MFGMMMYICTSLYK